MLDSATKHRIDNARDILVGKVPDPKAQVEQITTALIYKFMDDMDQESIALGGKASFFVGEYAKYAWPKVITKSQGGYERLALYSEAITEMSQNPHLPQLFRDIFKDAFLPYRDPETLNLFLKEIDGFKYDNSERLGDAFEYLLSIMGSQGAAGQFRTPRHIIDFIVKIVNPTKTDTVLDPACGTAGFLISAYKHILARNQEKKLSPDEMLRLTKNFVGYDISPEMVRLSLVNMYLHQFQNPTVFEYDTLTSEERWDDSFDVILANPPFMSPKGGIRPHTRFAVQAKRSEVLFVDYIAEHLNPNGRAGVIVPEGIIFQSANAYKALRKMLIEENYLYAVVSLPAGVFNPYSGVKTSILFMDKTLAKQTDKILFVTIENDGFGLGAQRREIEANDLPEALQIIKDFQIDPTQEIINPDLALSIEKSRIAEDGDFNLSASRYKKVKSYANIKWPLVSIIDLADVFNDGDWIERKDQSITGIRLIQTGNIGVGKYLDKPDHARYISEETFNALNCKEVFEGDVLISRLPDPVGRACLAPAIDTKMITAVDCTIIRFDSAKIIPNYFVSISKTPQYFYGILPYLTGASRKRISRKNLEVVEIPLPPLEVQQAIVDEIEGYQKIIDGARQVVENYRPRIKVDPEWPVVELGGLVQIKTGKLDSNASVEGGKYLFFTCAKETFRIDRYSFDTEAILLAGNNAKGDFNVKHFKGKFDAYQRTYVITIPDQTKILYEYLNYQIDKSLQTFKMQSIGSNTRYLRLGMIRNLKIPLPEIDIQQNIVIELKKVEELIKSNQLLIVLFEKKIEEKIGEVWGEGEK